jgi:hypothetical protein
VNIVQMVRRVLAATTVLTAEVVAVVVLWRLGSRPPFRIPYSDLGHWLATTDPTDALAAALRLVAFVTACWWCATTVVYALACVTRVPGAARAVAWATPAAVRRIVDAALVVAVTGTFLFPVGAAGAVAAVAADAPPASVSVRDGRGATATTIVDTPAPPPTADSIPISTATATATAPAAAPTGVASVVVTPGDNLWVLAERRLADARGRAPATLSDSEIAPYWVQVCDTNRATLRSGDVDLIYPGEAVTLPPVP